MSHTFAQWQDGSEDAKAMLALLQRDDIWEPQARDMDSKEAALNASFPGAWLALFRGDDIDGMPYGPIGYILFIPQSPSVFEQHTAFITEARGRQATVFIHAAIAAVFERTSCSRLITFCPEWHSASAMMAKSIGAQKLFRVENFAIRQGTKYGAAIYGMSVMDWAYRYHLNYAAIGKQWHDDVFAQIEPHHEDDEAHNGFVGLALIMSQLQPAKAVAVYNTWAELARYAPAKVEWTDRLGNAVIDIGSAYVVNSSGRAIATIPKCQPLQPSEP